MDADPSVGVAIISGQISAAGSWKTPIFSGFSRSITAVSTALGQALLEKDGSNPYALEPRSFSAVEEEAILNGAYQATLQLRAVVTETTLPSTLVPAPTPTPVTPSPDAGVSPPVIKTGSSAGCRCEAGALAGDSGLTGVLLGLMVLGLLSWRRRRARILRP